MFASLWFQILQKIREQLNAEFERYRCDTEESMKRTLTEMKLRLEQRLRENQRLQEERDRLEDILAKIKGELNQIQSQVGMCMGWEWDSPWEWESHSLISKLKLTKE